MASFAPSFPTGGSHVQVQLQPNSTDDCAHVLLSGDIRNPQELAAGPDPLEQVLGPKLHARKVLADLSGARYISSSGIGWLLEQNTKFASQGGLLVLHSVPPMVQNVLAVMKLHSVLTIVDGISAAESRALLV